jgi:DNA-binding transcriptional LysR family regulator
MAGVEIEIRHLRAICAIADAGSLTKAASVLGLSQPALTAQLQRVERQIGGSLFVRDRHGAVPTRLGEFVLTRARGILLAMSELSAGAARVPGGAGRVVRLGGAMASVAIGQAHRLGVALPGLDVRLHMEYSPQLLWQLLAAGRLDAITTVDYPGYELSPTPDIACEPVAFEPVFVALAAAHRLAAKDEIDLADLAGERWAMTPPDGAGWPDCFLAACHEAGFTAVPRYTIAHGAQINELVVSEDAVAPCQALFEPAPGVVVRPLAGTPAVIRHVAAARRDGPLGVHLPELLRFAREAYTDSVQRAPLFVRWRAEHWETADHHGD